MLLTRAKIRVITSESEFAILIFYDVSWEEVRKKNITIPSTSATLLLWKSNVKRFFPFNFPFPQTTIDFPSFSFLIFSSSKFFFSYWHTCGTVCRRRSSKKRCILRVTVYWGWWGTDLLWLTTKQSDTISYQWKLNVKKEVKKEKKWHSELITR